MKRTPERYSVRYLTEEKRKGDYVWLAHIGWDVFDWKYKEGVRKFERADEEQAKGLCKLLNSIEEERDGIQK